MNAYELDRLLRGDDGSKERCLRTDESVLPCVKDKGHPPPCYAPGPSGTGDTPPPGTER